MVRCPVAEVRSSDDSVFFFQAEDGIRDYKVTGVQTCALPISVRADDADTVAALDPDRKPVDDLAITISLADILGLDHQPSGFFRFGGGEIGVAEIGRASCRERV